MVHSLGERRVRVVAVIDRGARARRAHGAPRAAPPAGPDTAPRGSRCAKTRCDRQRRRARCCARPRRRDHARRRATDRRAARAMPRSSVRPSTDPASRSARAGGESNARRARMTSRTPSGNRPAALERVPPALAIAREAQHLHDEQRIALRRGEERVRVADSLRGRPARDLVTPEATEREVATFARDLRERIACFRREASLYVAVRGDDDDARPMRLASDEMEQSKSEPTSATCTSSRRTTSGSLPRREREERGDGLEEAEPILRRVGRRPRRLAPLELGQEMRERSDPCALRIAGTRGEGSERTHRLNPRPICWSPARLPRTSPRDLSATLRRPRSRSRSPSASCRSPARQRGGRALPCHSRPNGARHGARRALVHARAAAVTRRLAPLAS